MFLIVTRTSLFLFFTTLDGCCLFLLSPGLRCLFFFATLDGCCLFADRHLGITGVFFFLQLWMGAVYSQFPTCNTMWHGMDTLILSNTLPNARDMLIANVSQCIVRGHHCPAANVRNLPATPIPPSPSCAVHHGPCPKATPHPPAAHQCEKVYQIGAETKTWRKQAFGGSNCKTLTTFNGVPRSGTEQLSNEAQDVFTCGAGVIAGDDGASCKGNEVGIPFQIW